MIFSRIFSALKRLTSLVTGPLQKLFSKKSISADDIAALRTILIDADVGEATTTRVMKVVTERAQQQPLQGDTLAQILRELLIAELTMPAQPLAMPGIIVLVGVNGSGKTTTAAKLAAAAQAEGHRVLLVAADTFRAAAQEQLCLWGSRLGIPVITGNAQQDPASVVFQGCTTFRTENYDRMVIDTSGRLHTDTNLMAELAKIQRVIERQLSATPVHRYITIDSMLGQNSLIQAREFHRILTLDGAILTKFDGTGKGGIAIRVVQEEKIPIRYIATGETIDALTPFDAPTFVDQLLGV